MIAFTNTSTNAVSYAWTFPGGSGVVDSTLQDQTVTYSTAGSYDVTLTAFGCVVDSTITMSAYITVTAGSTGIDSVTICSNDSVMLGGAFQNTAGTYVDTLTTSMGCDSIVTTTLSVNPVTNAGTSDSADVCTSELTFDVSSVLGGTPDSTGTWTDNDGGGLTGTSIFPIFMTPGVYTFTYTVTGNAPCIDDSAMVTITITGGPFAGFNGTLQACVLETALDLNTGLTFGTDAGGTWIDDDATGQLTDSMFNAAGAGIGTYNFTYVVMGTGPCANDSATITVTVVSTPNSGADGALTVCDDNFALDLSTGLDGTQDAGGTWNDDDATGAMLFGFLNTTLTGAGTFNFTYITSASGCADDSATVAVTVIASPNAGTAGTLSVCDTAGTVDVSTGLGGTPDGGGTWADDDATGALSGSTLTLTGLAAGTYNFTYTVTGTAPCTDATAAVAVTVNSCVGINEPKVHGLLSLYPNPSDGKFILEFVSATSIDSRIEIYNATGELLEIIEKTDNENKLVIDLTGNPNGLYYINVIDGDDIITNKVSLLR